MSVYIKVYLEFSARVEKRKSMSLQNFIILLEYIISGIERQKKEDLNRENIFEKEDEMS